MKQVGTITAKRGKNIIIVGTKSSDGAFVSPMIIYPRFRMNPQLLVGLFVGQLHQQILLA
jgi:hypothetical protein